MRTIRWFAGVAGLVAAAAVVALTTGASAGDLVVERNVSATLTPSQQTAMQSWVVSVWPGAPGADVDRLTCQRHADTNAGAAQVLCSAYRTSVLTAAQYGAAVEAGTAIGSPVDIEPDGSAATAVIKIGSRMLAPGQAGTLAAAASAVFGVPVATVTQVAFAKNADGDIDGQAVYRDTLTPVERLLCLRAGTCGRVVGVVE